MSLNSLQRKIYTFLVNNNLTICSTDTNPFYLFCKDLHQFFSGIHSFDTHLVNACISAKHCWSHWWCISEQNRLSTGIFYLILLDLLTPHFYLASTLTLNFSSHPNVSIVFHTYCLHFLTYHSPPPTHCCLHTPPPFHLNCYVSGHQLFHNFQT